MEDDLDASIIKATQLSLGKFVKRPALSDKLLRKPPFRFLHDIVTSVLKSKGFFEGLFEENELISDSVKDRESKILFLNKVISVISFTTGKSLSVKPSKIVAGQEPAKTNELLQCLALALDKNLSSDEAVKQFKAGVKIPLSNDRENKLSENIKPAKNIDSKKHVTRSSEKLVANDKDGQTQNKYKIKESNAHTNKNESAPKKTSSKVSNKKISKSNQEGKKKLSSTEIQNLKSANQKLVTDISKDAESKTILADENNAVLDIESNSNAKGFQPDESREDLLNINTKNLDKEEVFDDNESISKSLTGDKSINKNHPDSSELNKISDIFLVNNNVHTDNNEIKPEVTDQSTLNTNDIFISKTVDGKKDQSRVPLDKKDILDIKDIKSPNITRPPSLRPSSSRPGAPRLRDKTEKVVSDSENIVLGKVNIISENAVNEEEEETSIIIEHPLTEDLDEQLENKDRNSSDSNQNQSHLVQQILDSQKEFSNITTKTEIEWQFGTQKTSNVFIQEMEKLRFNVQALSRIANPLGKLLDHIQEDVEVMRQELQQWTTLYEDTTRDLLKQKAANEETLVPLHSKLKQLTADIEDKHEKLTDLKVSIHKNASRIDKLLTNGSVQ